MQTLYKFVLLKSLQTFKHAYRISNVKKRYCENLLCAKKLVPSLVVGEIQLFGVGQMTNLNPQEMATIESSDFIVANEVLTFNRMSIRGLLFHTVHYQKCKTRNNNFFLTIRGTVGELQRIICTGNECIILYKEIRLTEVNAFSDREIGCEVSHIKLCVEFPNSIHVAPARVIAGICIYVKLRNRSYVCLPPNYVDM